MWPVASAFGVVSLEEEVVLDFSEAPADVLEPSAELEVAAEADSEAAGAELSVVVGVWQAARPRAANAPKSVRTFFFMFFCNDLVAFPFYIRDIGRVKLMMLSLPTTT